ncbi:MAG: type II toxin-antitoxin system RelE/ParE family toxin [Patescibacteria group bacterium]|nr:type II toxin-antitoxin system RelE/ParE family toxin [Patescibacteria group bacterium]
MQVKVFDSSLEKFIEGLEKAAIAKVLRSIDLLEKFGSDLQMPHSRKIKNNLFELRVRGQQEIRIFYTFCQTQIILLHGFIKKSQKIPKKEIDLALQKMAGLD